MTRAAPGWMVAALVLLVAGCGDGGSLRVREWHLAGKPVRLPAHLDVEGDRYRLTATVALPAELRGQRLVFAIPYLPALTRLEVNGRERASLDNAEWDVYRSSGPHRYPLTAEETLDGHLELALDVEHRWTQSAWVESVPRLTRAGALDFELLRARALHVWMAAFTAGCMLLVAMVHLQVFLRDRSRATYGWFALQTFCAAQFPLFKLGLTQLIFGERDASFMMFALCVSLSASIYFLHSQFKLPRPHWAAWGFALAGALMAALSGGPRNITRWSPVVVAMIMGVIAYYARVTLRLLKRPEPPLNTRTVLACWIALAVFGWPDFAAWSGFGAWLGTWHGASLGLMAFMVLQSTALSREHNFSLAQADRLNAKLAAELAASKQRAHDIANLNQELKRQIEARARQLGQALSRLIAAGGAGGDLAAGTLIEDRYRVIGPVGQGAMGVVYEVERLADGARLALKVLTGKASPGQLARFAREAEIAAQLDHPNLVGIRDVDVTQGGDLILVMELVQGHSLDREEGRWGDAAWALPILRDVAAGLAAMHARGIVHRDLKPANVILSDGNRPKIGDFGISLLRGEGTGDGEAKPLALMDTANSMPAATRSPALTQTGNLLGTPAYMAPELFGGARDASPSADLFSFGVMAYQLLTTQLPHREPPLFARMRGRALPRLIPLAELDARVSAVVAGVIERCLAERPEARPSAAEVAHALAGTGEPRETAASPA